MAMVGQQRSTNSSTAHTPVPAPPSNEAVPSVTSGTPRFPQGDGPDGEGDVRKRKFQQEEEIGKRARPRIGM